jgi:hypothetical protein
MLMAASSTAPRARNPAQRFSGGAPRTRPPRLSTDLASTMAIGTEMAEPQSHWSR